MIETSNKKTEIETSIRKQKQKDHIRTQKPFKQKHKIKEIRYNQRSRQEDEKT